MQTGTRAGAVIRSAEVLAVALTLADGGRSAGKPDAEAKLPAREAAATSHFNKTVGEIVMMKSRHGLWAALGTAIATFVILFASFTLAPRPARASGSLLDTLFSALSGIVPPDTLMMARYTISEPVKASEIYTHAASSDVPYFAIIGGIEAAKKSELLTYDQCLIPSKAVSIAFGFADKSVKDAAAKTKTKALYDTGKDIIDNFGSGTGQQELQDQLNQAIPYLADLPTMCHFAYHTKFKQVDDMFLLASGVAATVVGIYNDLKSGDVLSAVADMFSIGISGTQACKIADDTMSGGLVGDAPIIGDLAMGACSGFAGAIIDGVHHLIKGAKEWVSGVGSGLKNMSCDIIGVGCGGTVDYGKFSQQRAGAVCTPLGGLKSFDHYSAPLGFFEELETDKLGSPGWFNKYFPPVIFACNDGTVCRIQKAAEPVCLSAKDQAALNATYKRQLNLKTADFLKEVDTKYGAQCPDQACRYGLNFVKTGIRLKLQQESDQAPDVPPTSYAGPIIAHGRIEASSVLQERLFATGPQLWREQFVGLGNGFLGCGTDEKCRSAISFIATNTILKVKQQHEAIKLFPYSMISGPLYLQARAQAQQIFKETADRIAYAKGTAVWADQARDLLIESRSKGCWDDRCKTEVATLANQARDAMNSLQAKQPDLGTNDVTGQVIKLFEPKFKQAQLDSKSRAAQKALEFPGALSSPPKPANAPPPSGQPVSDESRVHPRPPVITAVPQVRTPVAPVIRRPLVVPPAILPTKPIPSPSASPPTRPAFRQPMRPSTAPSPSPTG